MYCKKCGSPVSETAKFCTACGASVHDSEVASEQREGAAKSAKGSKLVLILLLSLLVLGLAGGTIFVGLGMAGPSGGANEKENVRSEEEKTSWKEEGEDSGETEDKVDDGEIDKRVEELRVFHRQFIMDIADGKYEEVVPAEDISIYHDKGEIKAVFAQEGTNSKDYNREYYFDKGELALSVFENEDRDLFFFKGGKLILWRHFKDHDEENPISYDRDEPTAEFEDWEEMLQEESRFFVSEFNRVKSSSSTATPKEASEKPKEVTVQKKEGFSMKKVIGVSSTSHLVEKNFVHKEDRVIDGDISTAWVEGVEGQGEGEGVKLVFDKNYLISGFVIHAGYHKNEKVYEKNSRPSQIEVFFSDSSSEIFDLKDVREAQRIKFSEPVETDSVSFAIRAVYPGSKYKDTVISEIVLY
ncbi:MAG: zinc ribbon domain-containing protein [Filifactor alocis]|nr:zinc ribbon domain-containing protein [Filifactor alocis]